MASALLPRNAGRVLEIAAYPGRRQIERLHPEQLHPLPFIVMNPAGSRDLPSRHEPIAKPVFSWGAPQRSTRYRRQRSGTPFSWCVPRSLKRISDCDIRSLTALETRISPARAFAATRVPM
jgi:hypothetical protein